jgi:cytochrome c oxidase subunit 4
MELKRLYLTWAALLLLLALTIAASFLPIGGWHQVVSLAIAGTKAALILWIFMDLRSEGALVRLMASAVGVLLFILTIMLSADYHLRSMTAVRDKFVPLPTSSD